MHPLYKLQTKCWKYSEKYRTIPYPHGAYYLSGNIDITPYNTVKRRRFRKWWQSISLKPATNKFAFESRGALPSNSWCFHSCWRTWINVTPSISQFCFILWVSLLFVFTLALHFFPSNLNWLVSLRRGTKHV